MGSESWVSCTSLSSVDERITVSDGWVMASAKVSCFKACNKILHRCYFKMRDFYHHLWKLYFPRHIPRWLKWLELLLQWDFTANKTAVQPAMCVSGKGGLFPWDRRLLMQGSWELQGKLLELLTVDQKDSCGPVVPFLTCSPLCFFLWDLWNLIPIRDHNKMRKQRWD